MLTVVKVILSWILGTKNLKMLFQGQTLILVLSVVDLQMLEMNSLLSLDSLFPNDSIASVGCVGFFVSWVTRLEYSCCYEFSSLCFYLFSSLRL